MSTDIFITGLFRTLIEILPFLAVLALELKGDTFKQVHSNHISRFADAEVMPNFTDDNDDDLAAVRQVAEFSVAKHDTIKYSRYSIVVITVIFFSKIPTVLSLPVSTELQTALFTFGVAIWAIATYKLYDWQTGAQSFYGEVSPFNYFRDPEEEMFQRSYSIPCLGEFCTQRHQGDILLINGTPIIILLVVNAVLISVEVLAMLPAETRLCFPIPY